ncbi:MAG: cupin domain-containing protein [Patescibacteria group bacterium]
MPQPFNANLFELAKLNDNYRKEVATATHAQITLMSIPVGGEVGEETHGDVDQILTFVAGAGKAVIEGVDSPITTGSVVVIPQGTKHNFINTGSEALKIVSVYAPPHHAVGTIHKTKAEADASEEKY